MSVEARPLSDRCNIMCTYCYQTATRESGNSLYTYDVDKMIEEIEKTGQPFHLFGGEILLVPIPDLERFWQYGYDKFKSNAIQTNGTLIKDEHIQLFKKYNVGVGISIDGADELNSLRSAGSPEKTLKATEKIIHNIWKLTTHGINVSIIVTLHRMNGTPDRLPKLMHFIRWLGDCGIKSGNIHVLEVDKTMPDQEKHVLTQKENIHAFLELAKFFEENPDLQWNPFKDTKDILKGNDDKALCFWNYCDPMNTSAVYGIEGDGALSNCGRTNKEGINWYKADDYGYERYIALYYTPDEDGGCNGCRFWITCGGSCPGESINGDFRAKTTHCKTQKALQGYYEKKIEEEGDIPITKSIHRSEIEEMMLSYMMRGQRTSIGYLLKVLQESTEFEDIEVIEEV